MFRTLAIMEIVAERNDHFRVVAGDDGREDIERRDRIVGRQHHAATGEGSAFFQMQIRDDEHAGFRQVEAAERIADGQHTVHDNLFRTGCGLFP